MKRRIRRNWKRSSAMLGAALVGITGSMANAMPQGGDVRSGAAEIHQDGNHMTIDQSTNRVAIDWKSFGIGAGESVRFNQPGLDAIALNRVTGNLASVIDGALMANGHIFLVNPNGVMFSKGAQIDVGGLVASTGLVSDADMKEFGRGTSAFSLALSDGNIAPIINEAQIKAQGGLVVLHAASVENGKTIENEGGKVALIAAKQVALSADDASKINFVVDGGLASAKVLNTGALKADSGYVVMTAKGAGDAMASVVNNEGVIEAKTAHVGKTGEIVLDSGNGTTAVSGTLDASSAAEGTNGGKITLLGGLTNVKDGASLLADGSVDGGKIETSGDVVRLGNVNISAAGETGKAGEWLIDPLDVVVSDTQPAGYDPADSLALSNDTTSNQKSWVKTQTLENSLNKGTSVTVEAREKNGVASITVDAKQGSDKAIEKTAGGNATLTLKADRNITINGDVTSTSGKLGLTLHADADGDTVGATILNGNLATNGGTVAIGSGKNLTDGTTGLYVGPTPLAADDKTVYRDRTITTNGGNVLVYGDVAVGLNGKTLAINTTGGQDGRVAVSGNILSGNSYHVYSYGPLGSVEPSAEWMTLVNKLMSDKDAFAKLLQSFPSALDPVPGVAYEVQYFNFPKNADGTYAVTAEQAKKALLYWALAAGYGNKDDESAANRAKLFGGTDFVKVAASDPAISSIKQAWPTKEEYENGTAQATAQKRLNYICALMDKTFELAGDTDHSIETKVLARGLQAWYQAAQAMATKGDGTKAGDTYLATLTSALENSVVAQGSQYPTFVGGQGSAKHGTTADAVAMPHDPDRTDGFYWTAGPEAAEAGSSLGKRFTDAAGGSLGGSYTSWNTDGAASETTWQPDGSGPYLTTGYGYGSKWDDVQNMTGTTLGFTQETNLAHSALDIKVGTGSVTVGGSIGDTSQMKSVSIDSAAAVKIGSNPGADGYVRADDSVAINGGTVDVAGRIKADAGKVHVQGVDSVLVNGITAKGNVELITTSDKGNITLGQGADGGAIITSSTADDAVVINEKGSRGSFQNLTTASSAITTGEGGTWKVYSASPELNTFGTNLNSHTNAQWNASSSGETTDGSGDIIEYQGDMAGNKYIFQAQPEITIQAKDATKTYGETMTSDDIQRTIKTSYKTKSGQDIADIGAYSDAFQEKPEAENYKGTPIFESKGFDASATRNGGDKPAADGKNAIYSITGKADSVVGANGYKTTVKGADLTITKRSVTITTEGKQTYGDGNITYTHSDGGQGFVNGDGDKVVYNDTVKTGSDYDSALKEKKEEIRKNGGDESKVTTPDAGRYEDSVTTTITGNGEDGSPIADNYEVTTDGGITVDKVRIPSKPTNPANPSHPSTPSITDQGKDGSTVAVVDGTPIYSTTYGKDEGDKTVTLHGVNGDGDKTIGFTTDALVTNSSNPKETTKDVGKYNTTVDLGELSKNYTFEDADPGSDGAKKTFADTAEVTKAKLTVKMGDTEASYGGDFHPADPGYAIDADTVVNGNSVRDLENEIVEKGGIETVNGGLGTNGRKTQDAGTYAVTGEKKGRLSADDLKNYDITIENGVSTVHKAVIDLPADPSNPGADPTKPTISGKTNVDGNPLYSTEYGSIDGDKTVTVHGVNGDGDFTADITGTTALTGKTGDGERVTENVMRDKDGNVTNGYDTTVTLRTNDNGTDWTKNYTFRTTDGSDSATKTFDHSARVTPHEVSYTTDGIENTYGSPAPNTGSDIAHFTGGKTAVNGDSFDKVGFRYNDFGGGYIDANGNPIDPSANSDVSTYRTNNVKDGGYDVSSKVTGGAGLLNNYTFTETTGKLRIDPKDINYTVTGSTDPNGNTTYTVTPKNGDGTNGTPGQPGLTTPIEDQFVPGDTPPVITFTPGGINPDGSTKIITTVDGKEVTPGGTNGNYRYNYNGIIPSPKSDENGGVRDVIDKPDQNPKSPSNIGGTGSITDNRNAGGIAGVDRVLGFTDAQLPFFKNISGTTMNYGSFDVSVDPDTVHLSPVAKLIPEPNQPKTQYREYTASITTAAGTGEYKMTYDGSRFLITPMDAAARVAVLAGDATKNVELAAQALHLGFADMGLILEGIDAVYVNFD